MLNIKNVAISIVFPVLTFSAHSSELNLDFIQGTTSTPSILDANVRFPSGVYDVDVRMNGKGLGRRTLTVSKQEEKTGVLCLSMDWLQRAGVMFNPAYYQSVFNAQKQCYSLATEAHTNVDFNLNNQSITFTIPQAYLYDESDAAIWDFGENGARVKYNGNFTKSTEQNLSAFGNVDVGLNMGRWRFDSNINASSSDSGHDFSTNNMVLSTPISHIRGDLLLGRAQTSSSLFADFGFYGVSVRSNSEMVPWAQRGYAPIISGIADSTSRIAVTQDGYTIYSKIVPSGPYSLDDIAPVGNGDITVTVTGDSGSKTVNIYPIATLPTLLRLEEYKYNFVIGAKNNSADIKDAFASEGGVFSLWDMSYGFSDYTLSAATILYSQYQSMGFGVTKSLGEWGALNGDVAGATADYDNNEKSNGISVGVKYAKSFTDRTDIQLLAYRYQSSGYVEFADFSPAETKNTLLDRKKSRYEARLSHRLNDYFISGAYWQQRYWGQHSTETGMSFALNTTLFNQYPVYINGTYTDNAFHAESDYTLSMSISIPFSLNDRKHYNFNHVGYSKANGFTAGSGVSAVVNDRLNYNINSGVDTHARSVTGSISYAFDAAQTNVSLSQTKSNTSISSSVSGSIIATKKTGLMFTKSAFDTVAVVNIKDIPNVVFNSSLPTNGAGYTVVNLNSYNGNTILINPEKVPENIELLNTSFNVVPTDKAIVYRQFDMVQVERYILRIKNGLGDVLAGGNVTDDDEQQVGFIARNGVLLLNVKNTPKKLNIHHEGEVCRVDMQHVKTGLTTLQEVICE
ncbi:outer membrane usher protein PefC [Photobacterium kishitanii]|uniref:PefC/AfrB family outer membrane usher protein n=1 Tax=Photobacterium kishitanii TaxID=318456 RepID=UPI000697A4C9|nr:PefC/AfrB family outer membrane usher protein [Photobacterium kishitanii]PSV07890.1 outer membrane usher protein PefC [Photobacterium kishitanii]